MANRSSRNPISAAGGDRSAHPLARPAAPAPPAILDRNGFDPNDFEWRPVPRRPRADGWTPEAQQQFIQALARTGSKRRYNTRMAMFLLRAYHPERFRHANRDGRDANEPLPPAAGAVPAITATLAPVTPADPAMLAAPERLDDMLDAAQALANYDANHPPKEEEPYAYPQREPQHPKVAPRARSCRDRRAQRETDADEGHRDDDYEDGDGAGSGPDESDFEY